MTRFLVGQILIVILVVLNIVMIGGRLIHWLHPAPWVFMAVPLLALLAVLSVYRWPVLRQALRDAMSPAEGASNTTSIKVWRLAESGLYFAAAIACLMGLMVTCSVQGPDLRYLGFKLTACMAPLFFGVILGLSCRILRARVESAS
ncbi:MAG: hypothetical protein LWW79_09245 [Holophagaceae bacterium]|nr:hypothetical protein [Holophagaceae bacterium]